MMIFISSSSTTSQQSTHGTMKKMIPLLVFSLLLYLPYTFAWAPATHGSLLRRQTRQSKIFCQSQEKPDKSKMTFGALVQLITMGAGAPSLGEYKRTDENGKMVSETNKSLFLPQYTPCSNKDSLDTRHMCCRSSSSSMPTSSMTDYLVENM